MTTDTPRSREGTGPSIHVVRARKLLFGGLAGGLGAGLLVIIVYTIIEGTRGLGSAAFGAALVLFFYAVGQLVMVRLADAGARTLLMGSMASYVGRVVILGLILLIFSQNAHSWTWLDTKALFVAAIAVVAGWIVIEMVVFSRLRIAIYDTEYEPPTDDHRTDHQADHRTDHQTGAGA
jgi:MFS family permease